MHIALKHSSIYKTNLRYPYNILVQRVTFSTASMPVTTERNSHIYTPYHPQTLQEHITVLRSEHQAPPPPTQPTPQSPVQPIPPHQPQQPWWTRTPPVGRPHQGRPPVPPTAAGANILGPQPPPHQAPQPPPQPPPTPPPQPPPQQPPQPPPQPPPPPQQPWWKRPGALAHAEGALGRPLLRPTVPPPPPIHPAPGATIPPMSLLVQTSQSPAQAAAAVAPAALTAAAPAIAPTAATPPATPAANPSSLPVAPPQPSQVHPPPQSPAATAVSTQPSPMYGTDEVSFITTTESPPDLAAVFREAIGDPQAFVDICNGWPLVVSTEGDMLSDYDPMWLILAHPNRFPNGTGACPVGMSLHNWIVLQLQRWVPPLKDGTRDDSAEAPHFILDAFDMWQRHCRLYEQQCHVCHQWSAGLNWNGHARRCGQPAGGGSACAGHGPRCVVCVWDRGSQ